LFQSRVGLVSNRLRISAPTDGNSARWIDGEIT
jgi:hypothetical protein